MTVSTTDPDCGMFHKGEHQRVFAYAVNTACDDSNFVLAFEVRPGNVHDSQYFEDVYNKVLKDFKKEMQYVAVDAGYVTPAICRRILGDGIIPAMPYKRPMTKKGFFKKYEYVYDEYYDCYICPENKILKYSTTNRDGYREYKSDSEDCSQCPRLKECTNSKNHQKVITRHVWHEYVEMADHHRHEPLVKGAYTRRKETIERVFADGKEKHGMRYTQLRGIDRVTDEMALKFACMNMKKIATRLWNRAA